VNNILANYSFKARARGMHNQQVAVGALQTIQDQRVTITKEYVEDQKEEVKGPAASAVVPVGNPIGAKSKSSFQNYSAFGN
jgi:hypothetical protein